MSNTNIIKSNHRRQQQQQQLENGKQIEQIIDDQRKNLVAKISLKEKFKKSLCS